MNNDGLKNALEAVKLAGEGIAAMWKTHLLFRVELIIAVILVPYAWTLPRPLPFRALLIVVLMLVLMMELLSMAIKQAAPLQNSVEKAANAAMLMAIANAVLVWTLLMIGH